MWKIRSVIKEAKYSLPLILLMFLVVVPVAQAQWTITEVISTESTYDSEWPSLAVDSNGNMHIAWEDSTDYDGAGADTDVFYKRYEVGTGWTTTEVVSKESTHYSLRPSLAVDCSDNIHIAWHDGTDYDGAGADTDVFYKRYEVGTGWTTTEVVSTESSGDSLHSSLAVDAGGNVHIAWVDDTDYEGAGSDSDIFYKRFEVGVGWTTTEVVSTESTLTSTYPSLAADSAGNIHIVWQDNTDYDGAGVDLDVFYKRYVVGSGWTTTEVVSTESTSGSDEPSLAVDSIGNAHIAWCDWTDYAGCGGDTDVFYKRYDVGTGWTTTEVVSTESTSGSHLPSLAVDTTDNVHIAWRDYTDYGESGIDVDIFYKRYVVGSGWTTTEVVSTESTHYSYSPSLAVGSSVNVHIVWYEKTGRYKFTDVFYSQYDAIETCDSSGAKKDIFKVAEGVYFAGRGLSPSTSYDIYVVEDVTMWTDGMAIPSRVPGTATSVISEAKGDIPTTLLWTGPLDPGNYDLVVDIDGNGQYHAGIDVLDYNDVQITAGFLVMGVRSLSVEATVDPNSISLSETSTVTIQVKDGTNPVEGATLTLSCDVGSLSPESGTTDSNGYFTCTFTAPSTTLSTVSTITAAATKEGYLPQQDQTQVTIISTSIPIEWWRVLVTAFVIFAIMATVLVVKSRKKSSSEEQTTFKK